MIDRSPHDQSESSIEPRPRSILSALLALSVGLPLLGFVVVITDLVVVHVPDAVIKATNGNSEQSLHTWWSVVQLAVAAVLAAWLGAVTRTRARRMSRGLTLLAVMLAAMSLDELLQMHEFVSQGLNDIGLSTQHFAGWALWIIPVVPVFILLVGWLAAQLRELPRRIRRLLLAAAFLFVGSAGGLEAISGLLRPLELPPWILQVEILLEESGEAAAASLTIFALLLLRQAILSPTSLSAWSVPPVTAGVGSVTANTAEAVHGD